MTILAFSGSLRPDSLNQKLVKICAKGAHNAGGKVTLINLLDYPLPIYEEAIEQKGLPKNALYLKELFQKHTALLIASPEHNSSFSAALKNTIDWVSRKTDPSEPNLICFKNKIALLLSTSPSVLGGIKGLASLRLLLSYLGVLVLPEQKALPLGHTAFSEEGSLLIEAEQKEVESLGALLVKRVKALQ